MGFQGLYHSGVGGEAGCVIAPAEGIKAGLQVLLPEGMIGFFRVAGVIHEGNQGGGDAVVFFDQGLTSGLFGQPGVPEMAEGGQLRAVVSLAKMPAGGGGTGKALGRRRDRGC